MDREKVVNGLYDIGGFIAERVGFEQARNFLRTIDDTVALLKEQKAVNPIEKDCDVRVTVRYRFDCLCGSPLLIKQPYCAGCGRSVKWE